MIINKNNDKISAKETARDIVAETLNANINNWKETLENAGFELKVKEGSNEETKIEQQTEKLMERIFKTLKREFSPSDSEESEDEVTDEDLMDEEETEEDSEVEDELDETEDDTDADEEDSEEEEIVKPSKKKAVVKKAVKKEAAKKKVVVKKKAVAKKKGKK